MKGYFSKFLNTLHEVLKASKDLKLHMSLKNLNDKDLKLEFNGMKLTLTSTFSMEMDFQLDIQYLYKQYPTKKRNIKNLNHLFTFYFLNYEQILKYLYFFEYRNYCSRFGHFDEVEEYWPASSEMNSINDGPIIEPYYHMRLMAVFNYSEYHRKDVSKVIMYRVGLNFDNGLMEKVMNDVASTKNEILHYIHTVNAFLRSNNIQVSKLLADSEFPGVQKMSYFFHHSFKTTLKEISDEHIQLKKHLYTYFNSLPIFFNEVQVGLKVLDLNHEEGKITESYFSKKMHFELRLQENDALFVEWGPVLNPILFEKALESANENEKTLLENVLLVLKGFPTFQRNYVKKLFLDIWVDSYRLAKKNWAL
ncbi:hypothetical protein HMI54_010215 [Coelomomyces lativittatus]|nr:hypothetical protein HMI54_010215 [Coelomomyces lativittatus]KAJ1505888.1 hypothetical protein HMI55_001409 [Coelomomyces lativittatus]KAJ1510464.1 hypothetical protein HMI56_006328 [Coelomomyces lativittatus]